MAAKDGTVNSTSHARSVSLPSSNHPLTTSVEEQLIRLRSSEATSTSTSSICQKLGGLKSLYDCVDDWLQLTITQEVLSNKNHRKCIEDLLDDSLKTLDVFGTVREVLSRSKESACELQSSLRRRGVGSGSVHETEAYLTSRKKTKKLISSYFRNLKKMEKQCIENHNTQAEPALVILREVEKLSILVLESLLCFLSRPNAGSNRWSIVSKVFSPKRVSGQDSSDVEHLDIELLGLKSSKANYDHVNNVQKRVEALESSIREIEEVSENIFRCLLKTRVSLLNNLNH